MDDITGLHHVGHVVRDMEQAMERYRRLGFTLPPPAYPTMPRAAGGEPEPFGTGNTHAYFPRNFVELVTVVDEDGTGRIPADAELIELRVPDDKLPGLVAAVQGTAANLAACLRRFEGLHILMFDASDIEGAAVRLDAGGAGHGGVHVVQRPVETEDGTRLETVRYLEIDTPGMPRGRVPEGRVGLAQNPAPAETRHPGPDRGTTLQTHPNGAVDLVECVLCVADADLPDVERRYAEYLARPARPDGQARAFDLDDGRITLVASSHLPGVLPGEQAPPLPAFVAYAVAVRDLAATERFLRGAGLPVATTTSGDTFVPAAAAAGVAIIFRQAGPGFSERSSGRVG
ncbi:VOC family protein [Nonomuraea sp. NPDC046570]|uniref:VOC family protein n=1 Tax=Nonomuraea sp. NPDC046570 TaxID=3155255 RepID=UPI0034007F40